jgi:hypothetical protein
MEFSQLDEFFERLYYRMHGGVLCQTVVPRHVLEPMDDQKIAPDASCGTFLGGASRLHGWFTHDGP